MSGEHMPYLFIVISFLTLGVSANECQVDANQLRADYQMNSSQNGQLGQQKSLVLWRQGSTVAQQHPNLGVTESWYLLNNQQIKATRFFDHEQRAIEYQPGEQVHGKREKDWSYRFQLISEQLFAQLTLDTQTGSGCELLQVWSAQTAQGRIKLHWLPALKLVNYLRYQQGNSLDEWTLVGYSADADEINQFFNQRDRYQTTDYADIGDDHSDPFLAKMINLGFIEHGASGFYNADGQAIEGQH
jgi:hypothetical protein